MEIAFRNRKLAKTFNSAGALREAYGDPMAGTIMNRLAVLKNAKTLSLVPTTKPERRHQLKGKRKKWSYPVFVDSLGLSPPALSWATAGGRKVFPKIGG